MRQDGLTKLLVFVSLAAAVGAVWRLSAAGRLAPAEMALLAGAVVLLAGSYFALFRVRERELERLVAQRTQALNKALKAAQDANQAKTDFLANISHELRTPLNAILGFSSAMDQETFGPIQNPAYKDYVGRIYRSGNYLLNLINNLLDLIKIESGRQTVSAVWLDMDRVVADALKIVAGYPDADKRTIAVAKHPKLPRLLADEQLVRQALLNVLSNAVKFTKVQGKIKIGLADGPEGFVVSVADNGIGIPPDKMALLAQPFYQVENVMTRTRKGSGLGLALVEKVLRLHGGRLDISSRVGKGTRIGFIFPKMRVEMPENM
ncbi:MAG: HAMP domain-containing sensor histidine kinase [Alphaproteobacteria bacterium]|nr:HAMP domain-containing sensor histidine kinase [Alphaproteobacteria bacterium]